MRRGIVRLALGLGSVALLATATACSSSSSGPSTTGSGSHASSSALTGSCGKIPTISFNDQTGGMLKALGSYAANYNGFDGTIYKSPWSSWPGKASGVKVGILIDGLDNPYQTVLESTLESDLEVVAEVGRGDEVVAEARRARPDVALLDVEMPGLDGISATQELRAALPSCRVLVVTTFGRPGYLRRAMAAGASGFVVKDTPARQLADAVRRVASGLRVVDPSLAAETLAAGDSPLTPRETDVLRTARDGGTVADIAAALHLSEGTVRNHLSAAIGKTGARTRAEAVRLASANGWLLGS